MVQLKGLNPFASSAPAQTTEITELRIYPIKSCRGFTVSKSFLTKEGLDFDRRWMFADANTYEFITIRDISKLTLIDTGFTTAAESKTGGKDEQQLVISIRNTPYKVMIPARPTDDWLENNTSLRQVSIWGSETDGYVYKDEVNRIFSDFVGRPVVLVYKGPTPRAVGGNGAYEYLGRHQSTNFPDVMPLQIANEASIRELNKRLVAKGQQEITIERFRPNIIVRGSDDSNDPAPSAWSEDSWKTVRIDNNEPQAGGMMSIMGQKGLTIDVQARCARCQVPNVEPETAVKDKHEPWDTLVSYRRVDEGIKWKPCFGMLSVPRNEGKIAVGMKFEVTEMTDKHHYAKGMYKTRSKFVKLKIDNDQASELCLSA